jgi:hypothetical protein
MWTPLNGDQGLCHSPELALLRGGGEGQEQQANVDEDLVGFWADLGQTRTGINGDLQVRTGGPPNPAPDPPPE